VCSRKLLREELERGRKKGRWRRPSHFIATRRGGDSRWGWRHAAGEGREGEGEGERGVPPRPADVARPTAARGWRARVAWRGRAARTVRTGEGEGGVPRPQCRAAAPADRRARAAQCRVQTNSK
jgi:hypothetical protein